METVFKIVVTIIVIVISILLLRWVWSIQIDVKETFWGQLKKKIDKPVDWVATRDPNAIYQDNKIVGNITGDVKKIDGKIIFAEICNTSVFNIGMMFEYQRKKLKVIKIGSIIGTSSSVTSHGSETKHNVMQNVICGEAK